MSASVVAKKPNDGPPKSSRLPSVWPSPTAMSTPHSAGVLSSASGSGSQMSSTVSSVRNTSFSGPDTAMRFRGSFANARRFAAVHADAPDCHASASGTRWSISTAVEVPTPRLNWIVVPVFPLPNITYAQGAIAITVSGETVGAIGVSGAPGGNFDEDCARAALGKIKDRMK